MLSWGGFLVLCASTAWAADNLAKDQQLFQSTAAVASRASGSPVGPPTKVALCHKGRTIFVAEAAVPARLAQGDTLGPCPTSKQNGNNGLGNGVDPQPPGNPPPNDTDAARPSPAQQP